MTDDDFHAACAALAAARRGARRISPRPGWVPETLEVACRLQQAVAASLGAVRGWKISGVTAAQQAAMGVEAPLAAPLLEPWCREDGGAFSLRALVEPRLECEFAFELQADLPPRSTSYRRDEVERAIGTLRLGIEVVDTRLPGGSPVLLELADDLNQGGYVAGRAVHGWRDLRYGEIGIVLRCQGSDGATEELARGDGLAVLDGDPVGAVVLLANLPALRPRGLRAGDLVTTGSCTGAVAAARAGLYEADFGALGRVRLRLDD